MLRSALVVLLSLLAAPAVADPVCKPAATQWYTVTGVAPNDTLNLREGPGTKYKVVARLKAGQVGLRADGRVGFSNKECENACRMSNLGIGHMEGFIRKVCLPGGSIWYRVVTTDKKQGWASARFLTLADGPPVVKPPIGTLPGKETTYRFTCDGGQRLRLTIRPAQGDARLVDKAGTITYLSPREKPKARIDYYSRIHQSKMAIRGDAEAVEYSDFRGNRVRCYALP